ncbi:glycosyltransferase family 2 protein [Saccharothrix longispora]|uniref:glycosyltransferase family 2 protein n=1 Tax=Saccharothrix longispora TaxID=33920 RepID=UPI0028FDA08D|nr:glycosyltransferase family 2 protein [Saccharothrix longispora]MDU0287593.1 glycosyltransferase family 2 protein [Saccharothrix longispora]
MGSSLRCTVIIPTYNRRRLLELTLDALAKQDLPRDRFEVLVVDDGSDDSTEAAVRGFGDRLDLRYFHQPDEGYRVARARNVGIRHARGEVCVFVDSGVLLHSASLSAHVAAHEAAAEPLALNGYVYCFNLDNEDAGLIREVVDVDDVDSTTAHLARTESWPDVREPFYTRHSDDFGHLPAPWLMYWTCHASARTEQVRSVGMYDEAFRQWGGEDLDLAYRLHRDGARFGVLREAASIHYPHEKDHGENSRSALENYRYIVDKYRTPIIRLLVEEPPIRFSAFNDVVAERGLPRCGEHLARSGSSGG